MIKLKKSINKGKSDLKEKIAVLITGAFSFVAALAWNEAIQSIFNEFTTIKQGLIGKLIYAVFVTVIAIIAGYSISKFNSK